MPGSKGSKFAFLKERPAVEPEEPQAEERASNPDVALPVGSEQYGRRADPKYAQINANIPADLRRELRVRLASEEREQQEVLEALIRGYLDGRFKV